MQGTSVSENFLHQVRSGSHVKNPRFSQIARNFPPGRLQLICVPSTLRTTL